MADQITIAASIRTNTAAGGKPVIRLENVFKTYDLGEIQVQALRGVSLEVREGEFVAVMGPSGSGKSTIMNILGCLDRPTKGHYFLDGVDVSGMTKIGTGAHPQSQAGIRVSAVQSAVAHVGPGKCGVADGLCR